MANEKRLIDAEAISRKLKKAYCAECNVVRKVQCSACWVDDVLELLDGDAVDAVEVVRCKDCKHRNREIRVIGYGSLCDYHSCDRKGHERYLYVKDTDFCSCGERKDNG